MKPWRYRNEQYKFYSHTAHILGEVAEQQKKKDCHMVIYGMEKSKVEWRRPEWLEGLTQEGSGTRGLAD